MAGITADPFVRLLLTGVLCLLPTLAFLGLLRLLDRLRNDVLVEHTLRMAAEEGKTSGLVDVGTDPLAVVGAGGSSDPGSEASPSALSDGSAAGTRRSLVLCESCVTLRPAAPGDCPTCGAPLDAADGDAEGGGGTGVDRSPP